MNIEKLNIETILNVDLNRKHFLNLNLIKIKNDQ